jgi:hypothetical protein
MGCKAARYSMDEGWKCSVTGDCCMFWFPNSKACAEQFNEGPDANQK